MEKKKVKIRDKKALALNIFSGCFGFVILLMLVSFIFRIVSPAQLQSKVTGYTDIVSVNQTVQVSVYNACGVDGIAKKVKDYLNTQGFEVVNIGNLSSIAENTYIKGNPEETNLSKLSSSLGIDKSMIKTEQNNTSKEIISVVIGKDYLNLKPFKGK